MLSSKRITKRLLLPAVAAGPLQPMYRALHRLSLWGMNIGGGGEVESSGELWVLDFIAADLRRRPVENPLVFDVGANHGDWAVAASRRLPRTCCIHCLEPSPDTRTRLAENVTRSGCPNVQVHPFGAGDREEETALIRSGESGCASLYPRESIGGGVAPPAAQVETVKLVRLETLWRQLGSRPVAALKLDIEGHELAALRGCGDLIGSDGIRFLQFEFGGCNLDSRTYFLDFWKLLSARYRLYRVLPRGLAPVSRYHETLEVFSTTNYLAISNVEPR